MVNRATPKLPRNIGVQKVIGEWLPLYRTASSAPIFQTNTSLIEHGYCITHPNVKALATFTIVKYSTEAPKNSVALLEHLCHG